MASEGSTHSWRLAVVAAGAATLLGLFCSGAASAQAPPPEARPNIVLIESDDQAAESMQFMPRTRRLLGDRGTTFPQNFATWPLCCPSRATLFTGQYAHNHGVLGNHAPFGGFSRLDSETALPVWLESAGYYTSHIGKYLNGYEASGINAPPGWTEWHGSKDTYKYYGFELFEDGQWIEYGTNSEDPDAPADPASYSTDVYTAKAVDVIERRSAEEQPFFLSLAYLAPHGGGPHTRPDGTPSACVKAAKPAARHLGWLSTAPVHRGPSFNEEDMTDKPAALQARPRLSKPNVTRTARKYRCAAASLLAVDEGVKTVIGALRATGELENTLVIYTSDNGFFYGEHRIVSGKNQAYEEAVKVPLLMRGPGVPKGAVVSELAGNHDLAPTIAEAAGATPMVPVDGRSLFGLMEDPGRYLGREILLEQFSGLSEAGEPEGGVYQAIRTHRFKYVENSTGEEELYDLQLDPYEMDSKASDPGYTEVLAALRERLALQRSCVGSECRLAPSVALEFDASHGETSKGRPKRCFSSHDVTLGAAADEGEAPVVSAEFSINGKRVAVVEQSPFQTRLSTPRLRERPKAELTATVTLLDGRMLTLTEERKICR